MGKRSKGRQTKGTARGAASRLTRVAEGHHVVSSLHGGYKPPKPGRDQDSVSAEDVPGLVEAIDAAEPGLSGKLRRGLDADELERFGPVIAKIADEFGLDTAAFAFGGRTIDSPDLVLSLSADQVLEVHADLTRRMQHPNWELLNYFARFMSHKRRKEGKLATGMFWPVRVVGGESPGLDEARQLAGIFAHGLAVSETYQVTAELVDAMQKVLAGGQGHIDHIAEAELPCETGFAWLDAPWSIRGVGGQDLLIRALSWEHCKVLSAGVEGADGSKVLDFGGDVRQICCARISVWSSGVHDWEGRLSLLHTAVVPFDVRFKVDGGVIPEPVDVRRPREPLRVSDGADDMLSLVHILWMFLGMEIVSAEPVLAGRGARRRSSGVFRSVKQGTVNVVVLRKVRHATDAEGTVRDVDWSCRWPVQGHWRHLESYKADDIHKHRAVHEREADQDYCAVCLSRLTFIRPYIKGPDGMPLKVSRRLYKLAR